MFHLIFGLYIDLVFSAHGVKVFCGEFSGAIFAGDVQMVQRLVECRADVNLGKNREMLFLLPWVIKGDESKLECLPKLGG